MDTHFLERAKALEARYRETDDLLERIDLSEEIMDCYKAHKELCEAHWRALMARA